MNPIQAIAGTLALLPVAAGMGCARFEVGRPAEIVRRYAAPEATQAVAVDAQHFYAIDNAAIGKYRKDTGALAARWTGAPGGPIAHLNSGIVVDGSLYAAHSNYPETPMVSSLEVFDTERMEHVRSIPLPTGLGSATWVDQTDGAWWVTFAHYAGKGGEPGKGRRTHGSCGSIAIGASKARGHFRAPWSFDGTA